MTNVNMAVVPARPKVQNPDLLAIILPFINRMKAEGKAEATITSYVRSIDRLIRFHDYVHPQDLDIDEVIDFLVNLTVNHNINWRTNKMYVAALRYYWAHMLENPDFADRIPYPKELPSLPKILSREELRTFFDACNNDKHRAMFMLMYASGLRRSELIHLKLDHIETKDGKSRIRIVKGKGGKDRYTVLSKVVLVQLREYFKIYRPKVYLFNGRKKGTKISEGAIRHAIVNARKRSGITKDITMHVLRHCFATHALEHGLNIKRLQMLMGHSSLQTTLIYLQISEVPHVDDFSPLDRWFVSQDV